MTYDPVYQRKLANVQRGLPALEHDMTAAVGHARFITSIADRYVDSPRAAQDEVNTQLENAIRLLRRQMLLLADLHDITVGEMSREIDLQSSRAVMHRIAGQVLELDSAMSSFKSKVAVLVNDPGRYGDAADVPETFELVVTLLDMVARFARALTRFMDRPR